MTSATSGDPVTLSKPCYGGDKGGSEAGCVGVSPVPSLTVLYRRYLVICSS